jgi:hypothetical protein
MKSVVWKEKVQNMSTARSNEERFENLIIKHLIDAEC